MNTKEILYEIDSIYNQLKKIKGELFQLKYGITKEDEFYQKLIGEKKSVIISFSGEEVSAIIESNFRHCLVVTVSNGSHLIIQKSSLKYISF